MINGPDWALFAIIFINVSFEFSNLPILVLLYQPFPKHSLISRLFILAPITSF